MTVDRPGDHVDVPIESTALAQLRHLLRHQWRWSATLAVASLLSGLTESGILAILAQSTATLVTGSHQVSMSIDSVHIDETVGALLAIAAALAIARLFLQVLVSVAPARIASEAQARLRNDLFEAYTYASWMLQSRDREGHFQEIVTNQVAQATSAVMYVATLIAALLTFLILVVSAIALNVLAAVLVLAVAMGLFALLRPLSTLGRRRATELSRAYLEYAGAVSEAVRLAEETHVFGVGAAQCGRIAGYVRRAKHLFFRTQVLAVLPSTTYQSVLYLIVVGALVALDSAHASHVGSLGAVVLVLIRAGTYGQQAQGAYQNVRQALPYVERLEDVRRRYRASRQPGGARALTQVRALAFEDVSFCYEPGRVVLSDMSFEISGGEAIGIVGPSGAGKSTLVQILLGLRPPTRGRYLINGTPALEFATSEWHRRYAFVPQEPQLLHASVADNIRFFRDIDDAAVERAARLAGIHDDVVTWSRGYDTVVGPRADAVSGGQQQRICLARALAAQPEVLVLDEPTSALDPHSEALIQSSLVTLRSELTLFVVAHRMSTLEICERVMVIVDGRLEAFDTASSLLGTSPYYRSATALAAGRRPTEAGLKA